jgi:hypothetical protein
MKEPGRETPGDGISAFVVRQSPPLDEALGKTLMSSRRRWCGLPAVDHGGDACSRLEKTVLSHDR